MNSADLPSAYVWRGIELKRVVHKERDGGSMFDPWGTGGRIIERLSDPPRFLGSVGIWHYVVQLQADGSWCAEVFCGGYCNSKNESRACPDPLLALDAAAEWWASTVALIPAAPVTETESEPQQQGGNHG